jgi:uncharacterized SAM-binding protein YcdF (DUF218 family)
MAWIGIVSLLMLSLPITSASLMQVATTDHTFSADAALDAQAVVILGGGRRIAPEYGGETVSELALERVRYGAKLARELNLPILVTGGSVYGARTPEGTLMEQVLQQSFGTPARWVETRSRDTHENAIFSAELLRSEGIDTAVLVTHDFHMRRSVAEFTAAGIHVVRAPVTFAPATQNRSLAEHMPSAGALRSSALALHEVLGYLILAP